MSEGAENRGFVRVAVHKQVEVTPESGDRVEARTDNISLEGLHVVTPSPLPPGSPCDITVVVTGGDEKITIKAKGEVVHTDDSGMGIRMTSIEAYAMERLCDLLLDDGGSSDAPAGEQGQTESE